MADILSQLEIDALLDISIGTDDWPIIFYISEHQKLIEITEEIAISQYGMTKECIYETSLQKRISEDYKVDVESIRTLPNKSAVAIFFQQKLNDLERLEKEKTYLRDWLDTNPEYVL